MHGVASYFGMIPAGPFHKYVVPIGLPFAADDYYGNYKVHKQMRSNLPGSVLSLLRTHLKTLVARIREEAKAEKELLFPRLLLDRIDQHAALTRRWIALRKSMDKHETAGKLKQLETLREQHATSKMAIQDDLDRLETQFLGRSLQDVHQLARNKLPLRALISALLSWQMDAYLFARMFRTFGVDDTPTNIVVYAGDAHIRLYRRWLEDLGFTQQLGQRSETQDKNYQCLDIESPMFL